MTFLFPVALGGVALIAAPILIHLIMRQKPRTLSFPAFQFLVHKHKTNQRKLRLRHLLLLALRMGIVAAIVLALAQPMFFATGAGLGGEHPVAVVFVVDTGPRMGYKASDGATRLDVARDQARKLLSELHADSKVLVLDAGLAPPSGRKDDEAGSQDWCASINQADDRIANLKLRGSGRPLADQIKHALDRLGELATEADPRENKLPRFVCVFSDRAMASWRGEEELGPRLDAMPPTYDGLRTVEGDLPELVELLNAVSGKLPSSESATYLLDAVNQLQGDLAALTPDEQLSSKKQGAVAAVQRHSRDLLRQLNSMKDDDEERQRLVKQLEKVSAGLRGVQCLFFDVGLDAPVDLAVVRLEPPLLSDGTPRQIFARNEKWTLRAVVRASGKDQSATVLCKLPGQTLEATADFPEGKETTVVFEIDGAREKWEAGFAQIEVALKLPDQLAFNNQRFLTVAIREPRRVLVVADDPEGAGHFVRALEALRYAPELKTPAEAQKLERFTHHAVYLFQVEDPRGLWDLAVDHVNKGGGLGVIPARTTMERYNVGKAATLLPGSFQDRPVALFGPGKRPGASWDLESDDTIFQHRLLKPFKQWNRDKVDFIYYPRFAERAWEVEPYGAGRVLVRYAEEKSRPALLVTPPDSASKRHGAVLLFTTPLDNREPIWTNYLKDTSFYVVLAGLATDYLAGDLEETTLNFSTDQPDPPQVKIPRGKSYLGFSLAGPGVRRDLGPAESGALTFADARTAGNYTLDGIAGGSVKERVAAFSVNLPSSEGDLERVDVLSIETLFGQGSVLPITPATDLKDRLKSYRSEPWRLLPVLMLAVLFLLAGENLLANLFYRREKPNETAG